MTRFHRGASRGKVSARLTEWIGPAAQGFLAVAGTGATVIASIPFLQAATIIRTRGYCAIRPESEAADVEITGAVGFGIVSDEAFAAGIASMPEPFSDADWGGWFVWRSFAYDVRFSDATGVNMIDWGFEVDSKAMRRVGSNMTAVIIAESQGGAYRINCPWRVLVKNP